jgi:two-component system, NtrC family, response regulator
VGETAQVKANQRKLLVVDDDHLILDQIRWALSDTFHLFCASNGTSAIELFKKEDIPVVLLDLGLPPHRDQGAEGLRVLEEMVSTNPRARVVIISGNTERSNTLAAVDKGACDIFPKPVDLNELRIVLNRFFRIIDLEKENLEERNRSPYTSFERIIGSSGPMQEIFDTLHKVAGTDVPILISGKSGTGKELIATTIHHMSPRKNNPFVPINCGAIPDMLLESELFGHEKGSFTGATSLSKGRVEYAHRGTLFLDEVGELAPELQVKMLRFLQEKTIERVGGRQSIPIDTRIIAATNLDLEAEVRANRFREDLYFRLAVVRLPLPPLRERGHDVIRLAEHAIAEFSRELKKSPKKLSGAAIKALRGHDWPGNVRELQNRVKRALVLAEGLFLHPAELGLPEAEDGDRPTGKVLRQAREALDREILSNALCENNRNISKTARALGISRPTLYDLMARHGL